ncbi:discoidin domain-containing protein [Actinomadura gamaensis]|uniref:NAD glycohydrolase translocation F5/8 type C domain-containing protein n=1 Tax=Actinomadura gamaensis TaxID=1763541 RepID=A0ABV9U293_9ACTN
MSSREICPECGATRQSGSFCDICGAVLDWGDRSDPPQPSLAGPESEAPTLPGPSEDHAPGESAIARALSGGDQPRTAPAVQHPAPGGQDAAQGSRDPAPTRQERLPTAPPAASFGSPSGASFGAPSAGASAQVPGAESQPGSDAAERARRLLIPLEEQRPAAQRDPHVAPVLPGRPEPARPQVRMVEDQPVIGGIVCPWCDTPNPRDRHFCRKCAMSLAAADPAGSRTRSWWRRILEPGDRETPWAGERPRLRRGLNRTLGMVTVGAVGVGVVGTGAAYADDAVNGVVAHFAKRAPITASSAKASHSDPVHGPQLAFDGLNDTFWGDGYGGNGAGQYLEASFGQPRDLLNVIITPGVSKQPDQYAKQARPQVIEAKLTSSDGRSVIRTLNLDDAPGPQKLRLRGRKVVTVRLTLKAAYGAGPTVQVGITEVEFFGRSLARSQ